MLSFILFADDTNYFLSHRNIETLFRDLSFIRGGEGWSPDEERFPPSMKQPTLRKTKSPYDEE